MFTDWTHTARLHHSATSFSVAPAPLIGVALSSVLCPAARRWTLEAGVVDNAHPPETAHRPNRLAAPVRRDAFLPTLRLVNAARGHAIIGRCAGAHRAEAARRVAL
eukprot:ctg_2562.g447